MVVAVVAGRGYGAAGLRLRTRNKDMLMVIVSSEASMSPHPAPLISSAKAITKGMVPKNEVVNESSNEKLFVIASEDEQANAQV
ncbi:hypothetical protein HN51_040742 [Arachis hypogaea]